MTEVRQDGGNGVSVSIGPLLPADRSNWSQLFLDYTASTNCPATTRVVSRVWDWLLDDESELEAIVVRNATSLLGFAHFRVYPIPLHGATTLYVHDFYVDPPMRKRGIGRNIFDALKVEAAKRGCASVQWHTTEDNIDAQLFYRRYATRRVWVAFEMSV